MTPEFWHQRWERGEIGWHRDAIDRHLAEHWPALGIPPDARVLVPLCGKSRDLLWLAARGHRVLGVEISPLAVAEFVAEQGLRAREQDEPPLRRVVADEIEVLVGDFFDLTPAHLGTIDAVFDRAALIALPPDLRGAYAGRLASLLAPGVQSLLVSIDYDPTQMSGPPFAVPAAEVQGLFQDAFSITPIASHNALEDEPGLRRRGLTALTEQVYRLQRR